VRTLVDRYHDAAGLCEAVSSGRGERREKVASGVYTCSLMANGGVQIRKMILLK
jgi:hypothetical protein